MNSSRDELRVDARVLHAAARDDRHAEERDPLVGDDGALLLLPVRLAVAALAEVAGDRLRPRRIDGRVHPGEQPARLDELGAHHGVRLLLRERRAGEDHEARLPGADVLATARGAGARRPCCREAVASLSPMCESSPASSDLWMPSGFTDGLADREPQGLRELSQLAVDVLPLAHAQEVEELGLAEAAERARRELLLLLLEVVPEVEQGRGSRWSGRRTGRAARRPSRVARPAARAGPGSSARRRSPSPRGDVPCRFDSTTMRREPRIDRQLRRGARPTSGQRGSRRRRRGRSRPARASRSRPSLMPRESGGVRNGNAAMSPSPSEIICRMTAARFVRRISGSVNSGRFSKSSSEYSRMAMPSLVRPERPERWFARRLRDRLDRQPLHLRAHAVAARCGRCRRRSRT